MWRKNMAALAVSLLWLVLVAIYAAGYLSTGGGVRVGVIEAVLLVGAAALPLVLIWTVVRLDALLRGQADRFDRIENGMETLYSEIQALKASAGAPATPTEPSQTTAPDLSPQIERLEELLGDVRSDMADARSAQMALNEAQAAFAAKVATPPPDAPPAKPASAAPAPAPQPSLPLDAPPADAELTDEDLIRALDFPADAEDQSGFAALKKALRSQDVAQLLQAAEDVLNMLAEAGIYMDDLAHDPAPPALWRRFASGERGRAMARIGGIRDIEQEAVVQGRMRTDPVFRDTSLHFQRRFDTILGPFAKRAGDEALMQMVDTRSGRAFQLLSRVSGSVGR